MSEKHTKTIAIIGNPNCGKTTLFNGLTGGNQKIGNWPGVTVERIEGNYSTGDEEYKIVDLPGIYSLSAHSEDEKVSRDYLLSGEADLVVDIVDATNLERNYYLLTQILEMNVPVLVLINMMDKAEKSGISIQIEHMKKHLDCPVIGISATKDDGVKKVKEAISKYAGKLEPSKAGIAYPNEIENIIEKWVPKLGNVSEDITADERWTAVKLIEGDIWTRDKVIASGAISKEEMAGDIKNVEEILQEDSDVIVADYRYAFIHGILKDTVNKKESKESITRKIDKFVMNRFLGIPIFLVAMYLVFWVAITIGGAFIDFFDIATGAVFVDGLGSLLSNVNAPDWLITILSGGIGTGIQTVATFIPIIFLMFFMLALLEDSGYMARAAFIMDNFMRKIGLPGKSFVPMLVGFGCTVPAIMASRTLDTRKDKIMTIFMTPLMSCGARLPVYALFAAAFFQKMAGGVVFSIYIIGILIAVITGFIVKNTLFKGSISHLIMELPPYHAPRIKHILLHSWVRLKDFLIQAGTIIVFAVSILSVLNMVAVTDEGVNFNVEDSRRSVLASIGKTITPIFTPMGIEEDNWPATVGLFTGIFAKEAVVITLNSLYGQGDAGEGAEDEEFDFLAALGEAFISIPTNLAGVLGGLLDPLGINIVGLEEEELAEEVSADTRVFTLMREQFTNTGAFAYLLFILIYSPCIAAIGAAAREMGKGFTTLLVVYLSFMAWIVATLVFQITTGHTFIWILVPLLMLGALIGGMWLIGKEIAKRENRLKVV